MSAPRSNSREKILTAAAEVAREAGPGCLSLDAVALRAGVSKGGLLYNFPSKAKLMQGLVETYVGGFERDIDAAVESGESLLSAFVRLSAAACDEDEAPAAWIFSAVAEDPDFLAPVTLHRRRLLERMKAETSDRAHLLVTVLAMEGLRSMKLFDSDILTAEDRRLFVDRMLAMAADPKAG
jgi:AcrR family transcriptional regulator